MILLLFIPLAQFHSCHCYRKCVLLQWFF